MKIINREQYYEHACQRCMVAIDCDLNQSACDHNYLSYEELPDAPEWIPVSERWPEKDGKYLVTISYIDADNKLVSLQYVSYWHRVNKWSVLNVIAWQPLPSPYKPEVK